MADYKSIIVFIIIFAVLVVFAIYLRSNDLATSSVSKPSINTVTASNKTQSNSSPSHSSPSSSNSTSLPLPNPPSNNTNPTTSGSKQSTCLSNRSTLLIYNGNFSTGTFTDWTVSGSGFGGAPLNLQSANQNGDYYQNKWSNYNGQYAATTYKENSPLSPGNLSTSFVVREPYLNFQITSPQNNNLYLEVLFDNAPMIIAHYDTLKAQGGSPIGKFASATLNMSSLLCKSVTLKIVSNVYEVSSSDENQFIGVGNFYQSRSQSQSSGVNVTLNLK